MKKYLSYAVLVFTFTCFLGCYKAGPAGKADELTFSIWGAFGNGTPNAGPAAEDNSPDTDSLVCTTNADCKNGIACNALTKKCVAGTWTKIAGLQPTFIDTLASDDENNIYAVTDESGHTVKMNHDGHQWQPILETDDLLNIHLRHFEKLSILVRGSDIYFLAGSVLLRSRDMAISWSVIPFPEPKSLRFAETSHYIFTVGGNEDGVATKIYRSVDGDVWEPFFQPPQGCWPINHLPGLVLGIGSSLVVECAQDLQVCDENSGVCRQIQKNQDYVGVFSLKNTDSFLSYVGRNNAGYALLKRNINGNGNWEVSALPMLDESIRFKMKHGTAVLMNNQVLLGFHAGVMSSRGDHWEDISAGLELRHGNSVEDLLPVAGTLYAGTRFGLYSYNGAAWVQDRSSLPCNFPATLLSTGAVVFAACGEHYAGGLFLSSDSGKTWEKKTLLDRAENWNEAGVDFIFADEQGNLYALGHGKVFKSVDRGLQWSFIGSPGEDNAWESAGTTFKGSLYAVFGAHGGLYKYRDGVQWDATPLTGRKLNAFAKNSSKLFVGGGDLYQSEDGMNWQDMAVPDMAPITSLFANDARLYVISNGKAYASQDAGDHWKLLDSGIIIAEKMQKILQARDRAIAVTDKAVYYLDQQSENETWMRLTTDGLKGRVYESGVYSGKIYLFTNQGIFTYDLAG